MLGISGFKTAKPRQFSYKPRYYDPEQEERNLRNNLNEEQSSKEYKPGSLVRGMRMERHKPSSNINSKHMQEEARKRVLIRLIIFLILLISIGYLIWNSTLLEKIFMGFVK